MTDAAGAVTHIDTTEAPLDGRSRRVVRSKAAILAACRFLMQSGMFQPPAKNVATGAECSVRTVFEHFRDVDRLHVAALECPLTRASILTAVCGADAAMPVYVAERIVRAVVLGRA